MTILMAIGTVLGCSNQKKETWYDVASETSSNEDKHIADQESFGVSPEDARADYTRRLFTIRTEGRDTKLTLEGEELKQSVSRPE